MATAAEGLEATLELNRLLDERQLRLLSDDEAELLKQLRYALFAADDFPAGDPQYHKTRLV